MFKDKQSPGVCGVEAEVLLYAQSPSEALDTYIYVFHRAVGVQITHTVLICWFAVEVQGEQLVSEGIKELRVMDSMHNVHFASHVRLGHWIGLDVFMLFTNTNLT